MAVTADAVSQSSNAGGSATTTWPHVVTSSGGNRALIVGVTVRGMTAASGLTFDGAVLAFVGRRAGTTVAVELWEIVNPNPGSHSVVLTMPSAEVIGVVALSATNVSQSSPTRGFFENSATSAAPAVTVTDGAVGDLIVDILAFQSNTVPPTVTGIGSGQTSNGSGNSGSSTAHVCFSGTRKDGAASVAMSETLSTSRPWALGAVALANDDYVTPGGLVIPRRPHRGLSMRGRRRR